MNNNIHLTPEYLSTDFLSMKERLINLLKNTDTFRDINYEGANITMLLELISYLGDLTNFYVNEVAKNVYPDTSNLYETTHSLVSQRGYQPNGYISADIDLLVTVKRWNDDHTEEFYEEGDQLYIPAWYPLDTGQTNVNGDKIYFSTTSPHTITLPLSGDIDTYSFLIPVKQGKPFTVTSNYGDDLIDGSVILPFKNIDMGVYPFDEDNPSLMVYVNEEPWTRVNDFYEELSGLGINDNVYKLVYDKYGRYSIQFSSARNTPTENSRIRVILIDSLGSKGTLGANLLVKELGQDSIMRDNVPSLIDRNWSNNDTDFITNNSKSIRIPGTQMGYINESASIHGSDPETIQQIKDNSKAIVNTQHRNVTKTDYIGDLEKRSDIIKANVWGEQEINEHNIFDYNKVYISVIPKDWTTYTIPTTGIQWIDPSVPEVNQIIESPLDFNSIFKNDLKTYLEPKKIMSTYEEFVTPDLVYFKFEIGVVPKRMYNFNNVVADIKAKLEYYFSWENRNFQEVIDFKNIHNFLIDQSITSADNKFSNTRGIQNLVFRDIVLYTTLSNQSDPMTIFQFNEDGNFPMFTVNEFDIYYDNLLKPIQLNLAQFPVLASDMCIFINEA